MTHDIDLGTHDERFVSCVTTVDTIIELRWRILLPGRPVSDAEFEGDALATTRHLAVLHTTADHPVPNTVCCATLTLSTWNEHPARQLRGMATETSFQGRGLGRELLAFGARAHATPRVWWCNARLSAVAFYTGIGWQIASEEFDIPSVGPHVRMLRHLP